MSDSGGVPFDVLGRSGVRFVDYEYSTTGGDSGEVLLSLVNDDYCMDIEFDIPSPDIEWIDPAHLNGRDVSRFKYPNIEAHITGHVYGTDKADLSTNIRALFEQFNASNPILEWRPEGWADSLFIDLIDPPIDIDVSDWFEAAIRDNPYINVLANIDVTCEAKPFARAPEETIWIARHLGLNDSFEDWTGVECDDWVRTETNGGTVTEDNAEELDGAACVDLSTVLAAGCVAGITDENFTPVDETRHFNPRIYAKKDAGSGVPSFNVDVACYDDVPALLGTLNMLVGDDVSADYEDPVEKSATTGVIHPSADGDPFSFPVGTTQIKRTFSNDAVIASTVWIDCAWFGDTEYFTRAGTIAGSGLDTNRYENPATISIPDDKILGDVPTPAKLYYIGQHIDNEGRAYASWTGIRESTNFTDNPVLVLKPTAGDSTHYEINHIDQYYKRYALVAGIDRSIGIVPYIPMESCVGRYLPVLKAKYSFVGATVDFNMKMAIRLVGGAAIATRTIIEQVVYESNTPVWNTSGCYGDANEYFMPNFSVIDVPCVSLPDYADLSQLQQEFIVTANADNNGNLDIDYLMLIPIEHFGRHDMTTDSPNEILVSGETGKLYWAGEDESYRYLEEILTAVGNMSTTVFPHDGNTMTLCTTNRYTAGQERATNPLVVPDTKLVYSPLYLLVSEE